MSKVPDDWKGIHFGDLLDFKNGVNADKENYGHGIAFVNVMDVFRNDRLYQHNIMGLVKVTKKQLIDYSVRYGDILFNRTSETFDEIAMSSVYLDSKEVTFGGFVIRGRPKSKDLFPEYAVFCFQSRKIRQELIRRGQGAVRANIGQKDLAKVLVVLPPIPEQKKIAKILSTWDRAIEATEKLLNNSQQQKKSLMQQLLTGKKRLPGFGGEWKPIKFGNILKVKGGNAFKSQNFTQIGIPIIRISNIKSDFSVDLNNCVYHTKDNKSDGYMVNYGDVLIAMSGATTGKVGRYYGKHYCYLNQRVGRFDVNILKSNSNFIFQILKLPFIQHQILIDAVGGAQPNISNKDIERIKIKVPSSKEQQKIASVLSVADREIEILQQKLTYLKQEKKALMQQLLTGKRRVNVDDIDTSEKGVANA